MIRVFTYVISDILHYSQNSEILIQAFAKAAISLGRHNTSACLETLEKAVSHHFAMGLAPVIVAHDIDERYISVDSVQNKISIDPYYVMNLKNLKCLYFYSTINVNNLQKDENGRGVLANPVYTVAPMLAEEIKLNCLRTLIDNAPKEQTKARLIKRFFSKTDQTIHSSLSIWSCVKKQATISPINLKFKSKASKEIYLALQKKDDDVLALLSLTKRKIFYQSLAFFQVLKQKQLRESLPNELACHILEKAFHPLPKEVCTDAINSAYSRIFKRSAP